MRPKDDKKQANKQKRNTFIKKLKTKKTIGIISAGMVVLVCLVGIAVFMVSSKKESYASSKEIDDTVYSGGNTNSIDVNQMISKNAMTPIREEIVVEEVDLDYTTIYQNNSDLAKGRIQVLQEGRDGKQQVVTKKVYQGDTLLKEEQSGNVVTKASINKMVEIGTGNYTNNYKVTKGDTLYVTSYTLNMMLEPDKNAEKITTLVKGKEVTFLEKKEGWYKVRFGAYTGWVDGECLTHINPNGGQEEKLKEEGSQAKSKAELMKNVNQDMKLNVPSGLTLEQFKKVLSGCSEDKSKILEQNAEYFYYIEKQYQINGIFVAAVGIHESNWGSSKIAKDKKNLFGYGANDGDAYNHAYQFNNHSEGIDLVARVFVKYYLNPAGTKIYDGEVASGKYYSGSTLNAVNKRYASDKNWDVGVYKWMEYLYNRI